MKSWNDPRYAARVCEWERLTSAVTPYLFDALALTSGERVLDVGCGVGATTLRAAEIVGQDGKVVGVDISAPLIEEAGRRAAKASNVSVHVADAQTDSFSGAPFDAAMSQFGVMFFDDPVSAFENIHRHLTATGRLCFTCWQAAEHNRWSFAAELADVLPQRSPTAGSRPAPGPFALANADYVREVLQRAGLRRIAVHPHRTTARVPEAAVIDDTELALMGVPVERRTEAWERVSGLLAPYRDADGLFDLPIAFFVVTANA